MLFIFDLNGVLGHVQPKTTNSSSIRPSVSREPDFIKDNYKVWHRPNLPLITRNLLIKQRDNVNVGIWSSQSRDHTEKQIEAMFGKTFAQLLFVFYTGNREQLMNNYDENNVDPLPIKRDLEMVYDKYSFHNEENTVVISNHANIIEDYRTNEIIVPLFDPYLGTTNFLDDQHINYMSKYFTALFAMDNHSGEDVRAKINSMSYKKFAQKLTKRTNYDSYDESKNVLGE